MDESSLVESARVVPILDGGGIIVPFSAPRTSTAASPVDVSRGTGLATLLFHVKQDQTVHARPRINPGSSGRFRPGGPARRR